MSNKNKNQGEKETNEEEAFAGKKADGKTVSDGPLQEGAGNKESEDDGDRHADAGKGDQDKGPQDLPGKDESGDQDQSGEEEQEEEFKGKTYGDAFKDKDGNPRRHSWPEGQKIEFFETVAYLSYPPDGARKDLYIPTDEDIKATDWE